MLQNFKEKINLFFSNWSKKKIIGGIFALVLLLGLPIALILVNQRQDTRQQAASTGDQTALSFSIVPGSNIYPSPQPNPPAGQGVPSPRKILKGTAFDVKVNLNTRGKNVVNMRTKVSYDPTKFTLNSVNTTGSAFTTVNSNTNTAGSALILAEANPTTPVNSNTALVATLKFTATSNTSALGIGNMLFTDPTEVIEQNPGSTTTVPLTHEDFNTEYEVVDTLPVDPTATTPPSNPSDPIIETLPPTGSTPTTMFYNSRVNPNGKRIYVKYMYTTTNMPCQNMGTGRAQTVGPLTGNEFIEPNSVSAGSLSPTTTYYYCAIGTEGNTKYYGNVVTFTTPATPTATPVPMTVTTGSANNIQSTQATLQGTLVARGNATSVYFKYSKTNATCENLSSTSPTQTFPASTGTRSINQNITGLQPNTTYYFCLIAEAPTTSPSVVRGSVKAFKTSTATGGVTQQVTATNTPIPPTNSPVQTTNSPIPATNSPVPSPNANQAAIELTLKLPGIGNNANGTKNLGENNNPKNPTRTFDVYITDADNTTKIIPTQFTYSPTEGAYKGTAIASGVGFNKAYTVKVKTNNSLLKNVGIINNLASGQKYSINANNPGGELITGKVNTTSPNTLTVQDYNDFLSCYKNQNSCNSALKARADFTDDGKIDLKDVNILLYAFANYQGD